MDATGRQMMRVTWDIALTVVWAVSGAVIAAETPDSGPTVVNAGTGPQQVFTYKFTPGQFVHYEVIQFQTVTTRFNGGNERVVNQMNALKNFRVVSVETDGTAVLEPMVKKVRMSAKFNETEPIVFDNEQQALAPPQFRDIQATVGRPVARMTFTANGQLTKVTPLQGAPELITKTAARIDPSANFLTVFPKQPIGVGAVWNDKLTVQVSAGSSGIAPPVTLKREYTLAKIEGAVATITLKTSTLTPQLNPQVEAQLLQRQLQGTIEFDIDKGLQISHQTKAAGQVVEAFGPKTLMQSSLETKEKWIPAPDGVQPATLKEIGAIP